MFISATRTLARAPEPEGNMAQLRPRPRLGEASRQSYQVGATGATDHSPVLCFHPRLRDNQVLEPYTAECIESQATKTYTKQKRETGKVVHQHLSQPMKRRRRKKRKKKKVKHAEPRLQTESRATPRANICDNDPLVEPLRDLLGQPMPGPTRAALARRSALPGPAQESGANLGHSSGTRSCRLR